MSKSASQIRSWQEFHDDRAERDRRWHRWMFWSRVFLFSGTLLLIARYIWPETIGDGPAVLCFLPSIVCSLVSMVITYNKRRIRREWEAWINSHVE